MTPIRLGLARGALELRQAARSRKDLYNYLLPPVFFLAVAYWRSGDGDTHATQLVLAGGMAATIFMFGLLTVPQVLSGDREDGTMLRLRGIPGAVAAYLVGKTVFLLAALACSEALLLVGGTVLLGTDPPNGAGQWMTLCWVLALGVVAVVPAGAAVGALLPASREAVGVYMLPMTGLMVISGAFLPLGNMPGWLQHTASVFPLRWIAQGLRSAMLPESAQALEVEGSWQLPLTAGVLGAWAVAGFLLAPVLLRRMTLKESGSRLSDRDRKRMTRTAY
ncbi:ABC transporter permease [Streptomyces sp. NBC_01012]|uniref:ABC transporter permease n=1 Tax=Streptomyces sp. NBC_01012 TaxID=2903717 RepID=UPI00386E8F96|nr:ABC transporter permease [Streptomyces sp. NBC_01012]